MITAPNLHKPLGKIILFLITLLLAAGIAMLFVPDPPSREELSVVDIIAIKEGEMVMEGKGFLFSADGLIFTPAHLVEDSSAKHYAKALGKKRAIRPVRIDSEKDIALMRMENIDDKMPSIDIKSSKEPEKGAKVFAFTKNGQIQGVVKEGGRSIEAGTGYLTKNLSHLLELEIQLSSGQSGLPIFEENGRFIGMMIAIDPINPKISFAIPAKAFQEFLREYIKKEFGL
jgi:S1-C subfamily serine protease